MIRIELQPIESDPELEVGGILTLERADGRSVWRQRFEVEHKIKKPRQANPKYVLKPVE